MVIAPVIWSEASAMETLVEIGRIVDVDLLHPHSRVAVVEAVMRLRAATGPRCPICTEFLKARHVVIGGELNGGGHLSAFLRTHWAPDDDPRRTPCITIAALVSDYPVIAREMGL